MITFILKRLGLNNSTELKCRFEDGIAASCETQGINIEETVKKWKRTFPDFGKTETPQTVYAPLKLICSMNQRNFRGCKSVTDLFKDYGVVFKEYVFTNREWLEGLNNAHLASIITHPTTVDGIRMAIQNAANEYECDKNIERWLGEEAQEKKQ